jgi:hypothetical protein
MRRRGLVTLLFVIGLAACGLGDGGDGGRKDGGDGGDGEATPTVVATATLTSLTPLATPTLTPRPVTPTPTPTSSLTPPTTVTATPVPVNAAEFTGIYDVDATGGGFSPAYAIATVAGDTVGVTIELQLDGHTSLSLSGPVDDAGVAELSGQGIFQDDMVIAPTGSATLSTSDGVQRIAGSVQTGSFAATFELERPVAGTSEGFAGTYRFTFVPSPGGCGCDSRADLTLEVEPDGIAESTTAADETEEVGTLQGTFDAGDCLVTASGRLHCELDYETTFVPPSDEFLPPGPSFRVTLSGQLLASGGAISGSGVTSAAIFPVPYFLGGSWTAIRTSD